MARDRQEPRPLYSATDLEAREKLDRLPVPQKAELSSGLDVSTFFNIGSWRTSAGLSLVGLPSGENGANGEFRQEGEVDTAGSLYRLTQTYTNLATGQIYTRTRHESTGTWTSWVLETIIKYTSIEEIGLSNSDFMPVNSLKTCLILLSEKFLEKHPSSKDLSELDFYSSSSRYPDINKFVPSKYRAGINWNFKRRGHDVYDISLSTFYDGVPIRVFKAVYHKDGGVSTASEGWTAEPFYTTDTAPVELGRLDWSSVVPNENYLRLTFPILTGSGTSQFFKLQVHAYVEIGTFNTFRTYDIYIHNRAPLVGNVRVIDTTGDTSSQSNRLKFYMYTRSVSGGSMYSFYIGSTNQYVQARVMKVCTLGVNSLNTDEIAVAKDTGFAGNEVKPFVAHLTQVTT